MSACPLQPSLKRQSSAQFESPGDKRLRVSVESDSDDFAAIIARAAATVAQEANQTERRTDIQQAEGTNANALPQDSTRRQYNGVVEEEQSVGIGFDASANMCILSLPILESLVRYS